MSDESSHPCGTDGLHESPLEEAGFKPSVPWKTPAVVVISGLVALPSP